MLYEHLGDGPAVEQLWFGGYAPGLNNARPGDYGRDKGRRSVLRREKIAQENPRVDSAIHALGSTEIRRLQLTDLNRSAGRLIARRRGDKHTVYLDELTLELLIDSLRERYERWPRSTNPHLFVTQVTALAPEGPPVAKYGIQPIFTQLGLQPQKLRIDRILDEAHETADPVHLMRVFGIAPDTAMKYVKAAHPHRFIKDPTRA
ncbi:hypothetical protein [Streptomyces sp. NPDC057579]|uniref:hypothetical protein n=1 Tax=Streptomyces sp. NPDC057579 TaxID=3346172 RepID=UPI003695CF54